MGRWALSLNSFNGGELSPHLAGRYDIPKYRAGAATLLNFLPHPEGGLHRRPGTRYVHEVRDSSKRTRLIPFVFSTEQAYVLEFSENKVRVYANEGIVQAPTHNFVDADVDTGADTIKITNGHFYVDQQGPFRLTTTGTLPSPLATATNYYIKTTADSEKFQLSTTPGGGAIDITSAAGGGTHTITPFGDVPYELATTYQESELMDVQHVQSADVLYLVHKNHKPRKLNRTGNTSWTLVDIAFQDGPFLPENTTDTTLDPDVLTGTVTMTASSTTGINGGVGFVSNDVGRQIRWRQSSTNTWGWLTITSITSSTVVVGTWNQSPNGTAPPSKLWRLGAWYTGNYPRAISFFEQRLAFAGEATTPQTVHASQSGDFENFGLSDADGTVQDSSALDFTISANQVNVILWLASQRNLIMGTPGGIFPVQASSNNEAVTPTNVNVPQATVSGAAAIQPVNVENRIVYIGRGFNRARAIRFAFDIDGYASDDLTILADHILSPSVDQLAYQLETESIVWAVLQDGYLAALTYVPEQQVFAWSKHQIGGSFSGGIAVVETAAVIPSPNEDHDQLWLIVKRTINGATKRYVEFLEEEWNGTTLTDAYYVDCGPVSYSGSPTTTISGLGHLEAGTVQVFADGAVHPTRTVSSGSITLNDSYSDISVGLGYISDFESLDLETPDPSGVSQGKLRRVDHVALRFADSVGGKVGSSSSELDPIISRDPSDSMDSGPPAFSGDYRISLPGGWDRAKRVFVRQDQPLPMNLLSMVLFGEGGEQ